MFKNSSFVAKSTSATGNTVDAATGAAVVTLLLDALGSYIHTAAQYTENEFSSLPLPVELEQIDDAVETNKAIVAVLATSVDIVLAC